MEHVNSTTQLGQFYSVTQLANHLGVTARAVRFYEDKGLISPCLLYTSRCV